MTRVVILSGMELRPSSALQAYIDRFRAFDDVEVAVITLGPLSHWRDDDPPPVVLDPRRADRKRGRNPWHDRRVERLTLRGTRWRMARLLRRHAPAQALLKSADYIYVDQPAAVLGAWRQARTQSTGEFFTSVTRIETLLSRR